YEELSEWILFMPITIDKEILGWIGIVTKSFEIDELERITIDKCSTIIALEMLKDNEISNMQQSLKGTFFDNLLDNQTTEFTHKFAAKYNYDFNNQHQLIISKIDSENIETSFHKNLKYLYNEINKLTAQTFSNSISFLNKNCIVTIFDYNENIEKDLLITLIHKIYKKSKYILSFSKIDYKFQIAVSEVIKNNSDFKVAYERTIQLFNLNLNYNKEFYYYFYDDLEIKTLLLNNSSEDLTNFVNKILGPLFDYNHSSRDELFKTLKTYISTNGNWTLTKNTLYIHGNTLTYRINRLQEILGFDLSDYNKRFKIQIALEIVELGTITKTN
ncbi:MAG: helix-turn-helix domain-containing protein, partial [Clostridiales bacterium]|nr:helix-turn-helix domain-containing protein [Clostridiales bacterium]